jgi:hypothetical protein
VSGRVDSPAPGGFNRLAEERHRESYGSRLATHLARKVVTSPPFAAEPGLHGDRTMSDSTTSASNGQSAALTSTLRIKSAFYLRFFD